MDVETTCRKLKIPLTRLKIIENFDKRHDKRQIMLIEFTLKNFLSFKDSAKISMVAAKSKNHPSHVVPLIEDEHGTSFSLLRSAVIYGANASGKSNVLKGFKTMKSLVVESSKRTNSGDKIPVTPFKLNPSCSDVPTFFEAIFIINNKRFRYGFEATQEEVVSEWLYFAPKGREAKLFTREQSYISVSSKFRGASVLKTKTRNNALFLSVAAQFNIEYAMSVSDWFRDIMIVSDDGNYVTAPTLSLLHDNEKLEHLSQVLRFADIGIDSLRVDEISLKDLDIPESVRSVLSEKVKTMSKKENNDPTFNQLKSSHKNFNDKDELIGEVWFDFDYESTGTQRLLAIIGPIVQAISRGSLVFIDEFGSSMHNIIVHALVKVLHSLPSDNRSQYIYATHDVSLMNSKTFRKDQIWYTSKDSLGRSELYSLEDFRIRSDASFDKEYLRGEYGGIPVVSDYNDIRNLLQCASCGVKMGLFSDVNTDDYEDQ